MLTCRTKELDAIKKLHDTEMAKLNEELLKLKSELEKKDERRVNKLGEVKKSYDKEIEAKNGELLS